MGILIPGEEFNARLGTYLMYPIDPEYYIYSLDKLFLFDGQAFEPISVSKSLNGMTFNIWYLTKKDGTNWINQEEMNNAVDINCFNFYETLDAIPENELCIGIYYESIEGILEPQYNIMSVGMKIKEDAPINKTYGMVQTTKIWNKTNQLDRSIYTYNNKEHPEYPTPAWEKTPKTYVKTEYDEDGVMIAGTHNGGSYMGNTILVVGANQSVDMEVLDNNGKSKVNFDLAKNEYEVTYKISPTLSTEGVKGQTMDDVTVTLIDTLPNGLTYIPGSSNYGEPETITKDKDNNTILTWKIKGCSTNKEIEPLTFKAKIYEETVNGKQYENKVVISSDKIMNNKEEYRMSKATINIINLSSYSLYKTTETPEIEKNGEASYKVTFVNRTKDPINDFQLLDILPYNGDNRGSSFNGNYIVKNIKIMQQDITTSEISNSGNWKVYLTNEESVRNGVTAKNDDIGNSDIWENGIDMSGNLNIDVNRELTSYAIKGILPGSTRLTVTIDLKAQNNELGDIYNNSATAQTSNETKEIQTAIISIQTIKREISGKVWFDENQDGLISNSEKGIPGIKLKLVPAKGTDNVALDIEGNEIPETTTDEEGNYSFENMKPNIYYVIIYLGDTKYQLTKINIGDNNKINSKFDTYGIYDGIVNCNLEGSSHTKVENINAGLITRYDLSKATDTPEIKPNGEASYKVTFENKTSNTLYDFKLLDILPYNGDDRGSNFSGNYIVKNIKITQQDITTSEISNSGNWKVYLTNDESVRNGVTAENDDIGESDVWENGINMSGNLNIDVNRELTSYAIRGLLPRNTRLTVTIELQTQDNQPGDIYKNVATAHNGEETEKLQSEIVTVETKKREISGKVWLDENQDGLISDSEKGIPGITLKLLRFDGCAALDIKGNEIPEVITDDEGNYLFEDMEQNGYRVVICLEDTQYQLTEPNVGENDKINSKFGKYNYADGMVYCDLREDVSYVKKENINAGLILKYNLYKTTDTPDITANGEASYKVIFENKTINTLTDFKLLDILPYNGDDRGSKFNGNYIIKNIKVTQQAITPSEVSRNADLKVYLTNDQSVRDGVSAKNDDIGNSDIWENGIDKTGELNIDVNRELTAYAIRGILHRNTRLIVTINIQTQNNKIGDIYKNLATAHNGKEKEEIQSEIIPVETTITNVLVHHYIEGTTTKVPLANGETAEDVTITGQVDDEYTTEVAKNIASKYELVEVPTNASGRMTEEQIVVTYYYRLKQSSVLVHHYIEGTTTKLSEDVKINGSIDDPYTTSKATDIPSKYELVEIPENAEGTLTENQITVIYYYKLKDTSVRVKYLEKGTNKVLAEEITIEGKVDDNYVTEKKSIENYTYVEDTNNTIGTMTEEQITVIYYYLQNTSARVQYIDKTTGDIIDEEVKTGLVGDLFETTAKDFRNYILVEEPEQKSVNMTKEEIVLKYYYIQVSAGVVEKHIDITTNEILANEIHQGNEGDQYSIPSREFEGYDLVETRLPANATGTMQIVMIEVKYYYIKKAEVIVKYIDKTTGKKLTQDETQTGHEGDRYITENKIFENYDLVEIPKNASGTMIGGTTTVTYEYVHKSAGVVERHYDINTNELLENETRYTGHEGDDYSTKEKQFNGYDVVEEKLPKNAQGKMTIEEIQVNYYYIKKTSVTIKYIDKITGKEIENKETINGHEGDKYETEPKEIAGYDLIKEEIPNNKDGNMTKEEITVIYYYKRPAEVEVKYIDRTTNKELVNKESIKGHEEDNYKTEAKEIPYYKLVDKTNNTEGKMKVQIIKQQDGTEKINNKITVIYYYEPLRFNFKVDKVISKVYINGEEKPVLDGNLAKIEIHKKKLNETTLKVEYKIKVTNDGELKGNTTLIEKIPDGFEMRQDENEGWKIEDGIAQIETGNIEVGEEKEYKVVLEWKKGEGNTGNKENTAYTMKTENEAGFKEATEDDNQDSATLIVTISTGDKDISGVITIITISILVAGTVILQGKRKNN